YELKARGASLHLGLQQLKIFRRNVDVEGFRKTLLNRSASVGATLPLKSLRLDFSRIDRLFHTLLLASHIRHAPISLYRDRVVDASSKCQSSFFRTASRARCRRVFTTSLVTSRISAVSSVFNSSTSRSSKTAR